MTSMGRLPSNGQAQFIKLSPDSDIVKYVCEPFNQKRGDYFLSYNGVSEFAKTPAYVDIQIKVAENSFLFTGSLVGGLL